MSGTFGKVLDTSRSTHQWWKSLEDSRVLWNFLEDHVWREALCSEHLWVLVGSI